MNQVFADTGYFIALLDPDDRLCRKARDLGTSLASSRVITTTAIQLEVANHFSSHGRHYRHRAAVFVQVMSRDEQLEVVHPSPLDIQQALDLYRQRPDKHWSLTDCLSFNVMRARGLEAALAHDAHFEQAGFRALLRDETTT